MRDTMAARKVSPFELCHVSWFECAYSWVGAESKFYFYIDMAVSFLSKSLKMLGHLTPCHFR